MSLILGLDAGGTYTDSVIFDSKTQKIISEGKSLTTNFNFSIGIKKSIDISLNKISTNNQKQIKLIVVSSTLATNSVINSTGCRVGLILVGFDQSILKNQKLLKVCKNGEIFLTPGGHNADGIEIQKLKLYEIDKFLKRNLDKIESIAITSQFSTRNPDHENRIKEYIRKKVQLPITCSHDLTFNLNGPKRAITCVLNASLTNIIDGLLIDIEKIIFEKNLKSKLMIVKGDGSLINANTARLKPIDTTMSGPAASSVGAVWLTNKKNAIVVDIGGTTTDISLIKSGFPSISKKGAEIGKWETMVESLSIKTTGLGGDSEVSLPQNNLFNNLQIGPKRIIPLSLGAKNEPLIIEFLQKQSAYPISSKTDGFFVWKKHLNDNPNWLSKIEMLAYKNLNNKKPIPISDAAPNQSLLGAYKRLINYNLVEISGFTPTDAAHVLKIFNGFCTEAAELGALIFSKQKNASGNLIAQTKEEFSEIVIKSLIDESAFSICDFVLSNETMNFKENRLKKDFLLQEILSGEKRKLAQIDLKINLPIISIGASAPCYYPKISSKLKTKNIIPENFSVAGAVGAAVGSIKQTVKILITKSENDKFRVHFSSKPKIYSNLSDAVNKAKIISKELAYKRCHSNGAKKIFTKINVIKNEIILSKNKNIFLEYIIIATAQGKLFDN